MRYEDRLLMTRPIITEWSAAGNTFTFHVVKTDVFYPFPNSALIAAARKIIPVTVVLSAWNAYDDGKADINEQLSDDEIIVFESPMDTISPVFYQN